jgi:hypothetical protein
MGTDRQSSDLQIESEIKLLTKIKSSFIIRFIGSYKSDDEIWVWLSFLRGCLSTNDVEVTDYHGIL